MHTQTPLRRFLIAATATLASTSILAGGPLDTNPNDPDGVERWPNGGANIPFNPDGQPAGGPNALALGPLTYTEAVNLVEVAYDTWENIPTATATYSNNGPMPFDVDETNFQPFVDNLFFGNNNADGFSPIVFDDDGAIFTALFGVSGVLGFASTDTRDANGTPIEAVSFLNGGSILGGFPVADFEGVLFHEFGHYSGLGHTVVNGQRIALGDTSGPTPFDTYGASPPDQTETMYPFALVGGGQVTPHADDIAYYSFIYPSATYFAESGTITGQILAPDGVTGLTGVNVIARNVNDPFVDAVSAISGDRAGNGIYTINGLTPGETYTVHIDQILQGGFSTTPIQLPGPEEFYNAGESNNNTAPDDPSVATGITVAAGSPVTGIDIIFNSPPPGSLDLGDDDSVELFLPFAFNLCGQEFNSVFVNSNGSLTFGAGSTDFSESAADHLLGPPRIAGLFDDLNPAVGGSISFEETAETFTVVYDSVPEFGIPSSNSFAITLFAATTDVLADDQKPRGRTVGEPNNLFAIEYGGIGATDGLSGMSCGGAVANGLEPSRDLDSVLLPIGSQIEPALYELYNTANPNDRSGTVLLLASQTFFDRLEPRNTIERANPVFRLPFDTLNRYHDITAGDVDFWRFRARAGQTVVAEIETGTLDSVLGLYKLERDGSANLIALDDDGGAGTLSALTVPLTESGTYAIAVSTFPDFDFVGAGFSTGRYGLTLDTINGFLLNLGDDTSAEVDIGFDFPFQGATYSSVFVNSNGNLTFGSGDTDFSDSVGELLSDQPRIAPLWDDLSPNQGGRVIVEQSPGAFTVSFQDVPEFFSSTTNSFSVTLTSDGGIEFDYGAIAASDGTVGISAGGGAADPGATDLSAAPNQSNAGTVYEAFSFANPNDLADLIISFTN